MNIQGFQKMTLLDFPGRVACTVFTGGCNLRCPFCHNGGLVRTPMEHGNMTEVVFDYLSRRRGILDGVCLTGGEPLLQPDLKDFLLRLHEMGYLVKLDTNGALPKRLSSHATAVLPCRVKSEPIQQVNRLSSSTSIILSTIITGTPAALAASMSRSFPATVSMASIT